jgi:aryl sulfotransferase
MVERNISWPVKTRDLRNHHFDSTAWDEFTYRDDDIVIASYAKSGTTWVQQIVAQLVFDGAEGLEVAALSPWLDMRSPPRAEKLALLEAQRHRRFIKTHLPVDALVFSPRAKYLYIGRDGRDVLWSFRNHHVNANDAYYQRLETDPARGGGPFDRPKGTIHDYYHAWLDRNGHPYWPYWENVRAWWDVRHVPNVMLLHFAALSRDLAGQSRRIAAFLSIQIDEARWPAILDHCGFAYMKAHAEASVPVRGDAWAGGARTFIHQGMDGRWRDVLSPAESQKYEAMAERELGATCARWLATGEEPDQA